jgi:hypothetical protein
MSVMLCQLSSVVSFLVLKNIKCKKGKKCKKKVFEEKMSDILMKKWRSWGAAFLSSTMIC